MSARRRRPGRRAVPALIALLAVGALAVYLAVRLLSGALGLARTDGGPVARDPQFAGPAEIVTRPPELSGDGDAPAPDEDPSAGWDPGEQTPVDKTAEQLAEEAASGR